MGWFWASGSEGGVSGDSKPLQPTRYESSTGGCPVISKSSSQSQCPVKKSSGISDDDFNPLNNMPFNVSSEKAPGQKVVLSTERTISSIPRGLSNDQGNWEYPLPQQMLNAMLRKGKGQDIPEDAVELMVDVHNFLNEGGWQQILQWEDPYTQKLKIEPRLLKFTGRPHDLSPRARMYLILGKFFPNSFNTEPPFDRHDWTVLRSIDSKENKEVRYVIDYYSAPDDEETGMPAFTLDTRPALDSPGAAYDRLVAWGHPLWMQAMGDFSNVDLRQ